MKSRKVASSSADPLFVSFYGCFEVLMIMSGKYFRITFFLFQISFD